MANRDIDNWISIINEAYEGSTQIDQLIQRGQIQYGREASQYKMPVDYPQIKTIADLLSTLDKYIEASKGAIQDPMALSLLSKLQTYDPMGKSHQLDNLAKAANPPQT